jgi:hypothetical protein
MIGNRSQSPIIKLLAFQMRVRHDGLISKPKNSLFTTPDAGLSAYRFLLRQIWHVAVLGEPPAEELAKKLETAFARGEPTTLPPDILKLLTQRRQQASRQGSWVERHYRPGQNL